MIEVKLLGTGGMMPLLNRYLTSMLIKYNGSSILVDCGEATQLALRNAGESSKDIDLICITHFHADHVGGLPGLLLLMGNQGKTSDLLIVGPKGIKRVVESLRVIAPVLPYKVNYQEVCGDEYSVRLNDFEFELNTLKELKIKAFSVDHKLICYGYTFELQRLPKFDVEKAKKLNLDKRYWGRLQHGETVTVDGLVYTPSLVMGEPRKGLKVTYVTDTRPCESIVNNARNSDLFICEAMYADNSKVEDALSKKHMLLKEAASMASMAKVKELWLTHFSPSVFDTNEYKKSAFENTVIPKDGETKLLRFEED